MTTARLQPAGDAAGDVWLALHAWERRSRANGPGVRFAIWFQGCSLGCPGCFNPDTHDGAARERRTAGTLITEILAQGSAIEGVTVSGGEPFEQPEGLLALVRGLREHPGSQQLSIIVFSGFTLEEVRAQSLGPDTLACIDVLIDGRYVAGERHAQQMRGSHNQRIHRLSERYSLAEIEATPEAEIRIDGQGRVTLSGVAPIRLSGKRSQR